MLLRWGLNYVLGVLAVILAGIVGWQQQLLSSADERHKIAIEKFDALEGEAKAAQLDALMATRRAAELQGQIERHKRLNETRAAEADRASKALAGALTATLEAETVRKTAEARLADELKSKQAEQAALSEAKATAEAMRAKADAALRDGASAKAELARLSGTQVPRETASITPRTIPPPVQKPAGTEAAPALQPAALAVPAVKPAEVPKAATPPEPAAPVTAGVPLATKPVTPPKPPVKVATKPRPKPKPKPASDSFFPP